MTRRTDKLLLKIRDRYRFSEEEEQNLRSAMADTKEFERGEIIVSEGKKVSFSSLLVEGLTGRTKYMENGERQIMQINVPGDFVDLHSYPLEHLDHSVTALTACKIAKFPHHRITDAIEQDPRLGRILWFSTMVDASMHREWLVSIAHRTALERTAHLFCELYHRLHIVELTEGRSYNLPMTQVELGEALGLTSVHINRMLRTLREQKLLTFRSNRVVIEDLPGLEKVAGFDGGYLYLERQQA